MVTAKDIARRLPPVRRLIDERDALRGQLAATKERTEFDYLFVYTYGRSGSTLVQGLLNSIPGYTIRGENAGMLESHYAWWKDYSDRIAKMKPAKVASPTHPWYGAGLTGPDHLATELRRHLLRTLLQPEPDTRVVGFKEIRWWKNETIAYVDFVRQVFPGARFVMLTRDVESVIKSKWWADRDPDVARGQLAKWESRMARAAEHLGDDAHRLHYDDFVADREVLRGLFDWLGEPFDRARVDAVMDTRHSI